MYSVFFTPRSVAVVGAANDPARLRGKLLKLVLNSGYAGPVYPVHPRGGVIQGKPAFASLAAIPGGVDLVLIATPGETVPAIVAEAVAAGARGAVILSSGVDEDALKLAIGGADFRYMGPNTEGYAVSGGLACTFAGVVDDAQQNARAAPRPGRKLAIVSQSGGLGFALYGHALAEHLDVHAVLTTGNEGDIECLDMVEHLLDEGEAGVILMFVEGLKTPARLAPVARKAAAAGVPIIIMKIGRSEAGQRAAVSHTAHLTGADTAYDAMFERYGLIRLFDLEAMLAAAAAFARSPQGELKRPVKRAAVVTTSGGAGAWAADLCGIEGVDVPVLSAALQATISPDIPDFGSTANPVDATAQAIEDGGRTLVRILEKVLGSDEIDAAIVNMGLAHAARVRGLADVLAPLIAGSNKPILFHSHIRPSQEALAALADLGGQGYRSFRACATALAALDRYAQFQARGLPELPAKAPVARFPHLGNGVLGEADSAALLAAYGLPMPPSALAGDAEAAMQAAQAMGFPVVLKIQSPNIAHKTEAGGVALNVTADTLAQAFADVTTRSRAYAPHAHIEGVLVQKMMPKGHEIVVGLIRDADFGPLIMVGSGGIYLEVLKDVAFAPVPVSRGDAARLIDQLKTAPILKGVRGQEGGDIAALIDLICRLSDLAGVEGAVEQIDLNPVFVYGPGEGVVAVDSLIVAGRAAPAH